VRVLKPGATFRFASDIPSYVEWTLAHLNADDHYRWTAERSVDWTTPFPNWPGTRYEAKALAAGRVPTYLTFLRV
jgi:tRNA (guanine-N7-)-methyltransferase